MEREDRARMDWALGALKASEQDGRRVLILGAAGGEKSRQVRVEVRVEVRVQGKPGTVPDRQP